MNQSDATIVRLTGAGPGAIAVFAVAGKHARAAVVKLSRHRGAADLQPTEILRTTILNPLTGQPIDDGLLVCVADDHFELHVHGGVAVGEALINAAVAAGCTLGDVTTIAASPLQAELDTALPMARTLTAARLLAAQMDTGLGLFARQWAAALAWGGGENPPALWQFQSAAQWLLTRSAHLMPLVTAARIVVVGSPNAGKSTLVNALLGRPAAITSDIPGTTRDWVEGETVFTAPASTRNQQVAVPVILVDTAGVRDTLDVLEETAIQRTHQQAAAADLILAVLDASRAMTAQERQWLAAHPRALVAVNKIDLAAPNTATILNALPVSALHREGLDALMLAALQRLDLAEISLEEPFCFTPRQHNLLQSAALAENAAAARQSLLALSLRVG